MLSNLPTGDRAWFERWNSLDEFELAVEQSKPEFEVLRNQQSKFWREAWVATRFARATAEGHVKLRLAPDSAPCGDFQLEDRKGLRVYEIAEALDPSMPPAWKQLRAENKTLLHESDDASSGALMRATVPALIAQKASKGYPAGTGLIIYLNLRGGRSRTELEALVPKTDYQFDSIWILTSGGPVRIFTAK